MTEFWSLEKRILVWNAFVIETQKGYFITRQCGKKCTFLNTVVNNLEMSIAYFPIRN